MADNLTIGQLAELTGMTVRNIRAYQSKGLLYPPEIHGRVAYYSGGHVARLQLIASLQREGFTLAAIKRLLETPDSYARIVADRRRRFRDERSDITTGVPVPEARVAAFGTDLVERLLALGLAWHDQGRLHVHTVLVGVGRALLEQGVPPHGQVGILLEAAETGKALGALLHKELAEVVPEGRHGADQVRDLALVTVQLHAAAFELALSQAVRQVPADD